MSLEITINNDIKDAMRNRDAKKLEALRAVKASLLLAKTGKDVGSSEIPEEVEISLLKRLVKQRKESAAIFSENGKSQMAEEELYQAEIIEKYLPELMSEEAIEKVVTETIASVGATSMKNMGKVMGGVTKQLAGKADNKLVSEIVKRILN